MIHQPLKIRASRTLLKIAGLALLLSLPFDNAFADTVSSKNPAWVLLPNSIGPNTGTWALPAASATCGNENEPSCEPTGDFIVSSPFTNGPGFFSITDTDSGTTGVSDYVTFANTGPGGTGEIQFFSDPNLPGVPPSGTDDGVLCTEGSGPGSIAGGCVGFFTLTTADGTVLTISPASDGEIAFDPFGFGFDSSDDIKFTGVTPVDTPEPSSLLLLGTGLVGLAGVIRRKLS